MSINEQKVIDPEFAAKLADLLSSENNRLEILGFFVEDIARLIRTKKETEALAAFRPVVTRVEYPNSVRAEVVFKDGLLSAVLSERPVDSTEWVAVSQETEEDKELYAALERLVLTSTSVIEGDVFFITTGKDIEKAIGDVTNVYVKRAERLEAAVANPTEETAPAAE